MHPSLLSFIAEYLPHISTSIALLIVFFAYLYAPYWSLRSLPGPAPLPLVGHLPLFAKHGPELFTFLYNRYGPIYRFHMGRQVIVIVASPELCYEVGIKKFKSINRRSIPPPIAGSPLHRKGLFFTRDYSKWTAMRNTIISLYQPSHLASLIPTMQSYIESAASSLSESVEEESEVNFSDLSLKLASDIIAQAAFGFDFGLLRCQSPPTYSNNNNSSEVAEFIKEHIYSTTTLKMDLTGSFSIILALLIPILQEPFRQVLKRIPWTADYKMDRTNSKLSKKLATIVAQREREKERGTKNFLSAILSTREEEKEHSVRKLDFISSDYISSLSYEHLLAGSATTSFTLSCIIYLVSKHEEVEKKLLCLV